MVYTTSEEEEANVSSSASRAAPRLCDLCRKEPCKYRCPRCSFRTCSLLCSKEHKAKLECSGERDKSFDVIKRLDDFSPSVAAEDAKFLSSLTASLDKAVKQSNEVKKADISHPVPPPEKDRIKFETVCKPVVERTSANFASIKNDDCAVPVQIHDEQQTTSSQIDDREEKMTEHQQWKKVSAKQYLLKNAHRRRIWLTITPEKEGNNSRHEQYSDTIFWTIKMIFRREEGEGAEKHIIEYDYTVSNIPESISMTTLLRQFIKPKKVGPVVSQSDLDAEKMAPFQEAGIDGLMVYMNVPIENKQRFYVIDLTKTILENTRNRFILEHPTFIVTLDNQFNDYIMLSEQEAQELRELNRQKNRVENHNRHNNFRGRGHFNNGSFMSRGHSGGRGAFKRLHNNSSDGRDGQAFGRPWKFGRSSRGAFHQNFGSRHHRVTNDQDSSDTSPFAAEYSNQRPSIFSQKPADPVLDAWSRAVESKAKMEVSSASSS